MRKQAFEMGDSEDAKNPENVFSRLTKNQSFGNRKQSHAVFLDKHKRLQGVVSAH